MKFIGVHHGHGNRDGRTIVDFEQDNTFTYVVQIKGFGRPSKLRDEIGLRLAKACALYFGEVQIYSGDEDTEYKWSVSDHNGGLVANSR